MNKDIYRNIAAVTAIFIISLSVMLITNYFQVRGVTPLQTEVVETLKLLNDTNPDNPELQEQIRQLDLLARRAYFIQEDHLKLGVYILLGMVAVFVVCLRFYFKGEMHIPDKEIDPIDEWMLKSKSRKYITWSMFGLVGVSLFFVFLSSPFLATEKTESVAEETLIAESTQVEPDSEVIEPAIDIEEPMNEVIIDTTNDVTPVEEAFPATSEEPQPVVPKITHNAFRGNYSNGVSAAKGIPVKWDLSSGTNIAWKKEIPRPGHNSPVINGNHVFFTGADEQARELYCYDVLRADRCLAANSLEARVPFGDLDFVRYVMSIDPAKKLNTYGKGKYLLRKAFEADHILPENILWREKAAFSDAVGHSMVDDLKEYAEKYYTDEEYETLRQKYDFARPFTKESLLYREIFEKYYPGQARMVPDFWMPNRDWEGCRVSDPSARVLANYGASGV